MQIIDKSGHGQLLCTRLQATIDIAVKDAKPIDISFQRPRSHEAGAQIDVDGGPQRACIISTGWAYRSTVLPDGRHQIYSVLLPGDILNMGWNGRPLARAPITALTKVYTISANPIFALLEADPERYRTLASGVDNLTRVEEAHLMGHVVRLGCLSALERVAHLLLELHNRLDEIGFVHQGSFTLPMSQELMGNMLGLSLVHVNRTLKELKRRGMISSSGKTMVVSDHDHLARTAGCLPFASTAGAAIGEPESAAQIAQSLTCSLFSRPV